MGITSNIKQKLWLECLSGMKNIAIPCDMNPLKDQNIADCLKWTKQFSDIMILLMAEILHHLGCMKPYK